MTTPGAIRALAVLVSPALLGGCTASGPAIASLDTRSWQVEDYSTLGFTLRYPPQWHLQEFNQNLGMVGLAGVGVLNVNEQLRHPYYPNGTTTGWDMRRMPGDGVVVTVEYTATIMSDQGWADTRMPLSLSDARPAPSRNPAGRGSEVFLPFHLAGKQCYVRVWYGPNSDAHDGEVAAKLVSTIRPLGSV